jgi:hypothetical protein
MSWLYHLRAEDEILPKRNSQTESLCGSTAVQTANCRRVIRAQQCRGQRAPATKTSASPSRLIVSASAARRQGRGVFCDSAPIDGSRFKNDPTRASVHNSRPDAVPQERPQTFPFPMLYLYVSSILSVSDVYCNCFILMLQNRLRDVVFSEVCCKRMFKMFLSISKRMLQWFLI